jgi:hypothetical protein
MTLTALQNNQFIIVSGFTGTAQGKVIMTPGQANKIRRTLVDRLIFIDGYVFGNINCLDEEKYYMEKASLSELASLLIRWNKYYGKRIREADNRALQAVAI